MFCNLCGQHARHPKSPEADLRRKDCPRFGGGVVHRGCCAREPCSQTDGRGHVRCAWDRGGRERFLLLASRAAVATRSSKEPAFTPREPDEPPDRGSAGDRASTGSA